MPSSAVATQVLAYLFDSIWIGAALLFTSWASLRAVRGTATVRYAVYASTLLLAAAVPLATRVEFVQAGRDGGAHARAKLSPVPAVTTSLRFDQTHAAGSEETVSGFPALEPLRVSIPRGRATAVVFALWLLGVLVYAAKLMRAVLRLQRLKRSSRPLPTTLSLPYVPLPVRLSDACTVPLLAGLVGPRILLPRELVSRLGRGELAHIVEHEFAHWQRHDDWAKLVQELLRAALWINPAVLWLSAKVDEERELACDDRVLASATAVSYADALTRVAELSVRDRALAPAALGTARFSRRIRALLDSSVSHRTSWHRPAFYASLLILCCAAATAAAYGPLAHILPAVSTERRTDPIDDAALGGRIDRLLQELEASGFDGGVLVARRGRVLHSGVYGFADEQRGLRHQPGALFNVAGVAKAFTAVAIFRLEQEGRLRIDDPISRYLGPFPGVKANATIRQLLLHTAGLSPIGVNVSRTSEQAFVDAVRAAPAEFTAGDGWRYTDTGYSLLAVIIQRVTGHTFEHYIRTQLLQPAQMQQTFFENEIAFNDPRVSREHEVRNGVGQVIPPRPYVWGRRGALGMLTTLEDLWRWHLALEAEHLLSAAAKQRMYEVTHDADNAHGWISTVTRNGRLYRRLGGSPTAQTELLRYVERDLVIIFSINSRVGWHARLWPGLNQLVFSVS